MGMFDDALKDAVPGGSLTKPLIIAAGALLLAKMFGGSKEEAPEPAAPPARTQQPADDGAPGWLPGSSRASEAEEVDTNDHGGLLGNLGNLIEKFQKNGQGDVINSWIGGGQNREISPGSLGDILGQGTLSDLARKAGVNEQDLLGQLAQALPGLINNLTPDGRMPTLEEIGTRRR